MKWLEAHQWVLAVWAAGWAVGTLAILAFGGRRIARTSPPEAVADAKSVADQAGPGAYGGWDS